MNSISLTSSERRAILDHYRRAADPEVPSITARSLSPTTCPVSIDAEEAAGLGDSNLGVFASEQELGRSTDLF